MRLFFLQSSKIIRTIIIATTVLIFIGFQSNVAQDYIVKSYQISDKHRFDKVDPGLVGGFWGHHLGHMVRTSTEGLWYVDDTGTDVNRNPALHYHHFDGTKWSLVKSLANPSTIQQNTATLAIDDTIYTYGLNIVGGYLEEAVFDAKNKVATYNRKITYTGPNTNYIGGALSPNGTRVVWWTKVDYNGGPSDWVYIFKKDSVWSDPIVSKIPGNDFSYVFASFVNDTVFFVGGEVPKGIAPNWTYEVGAGKVFLGDTITGFTKMKGSNVAANDMWVNRSNGDAHLFTYGSYGTIGYFYKPANGAWSETVTLVEVGNISRWRFIDSPDGNLYLIISQGGFKFMKIPKSTITGKINFSGLPIVPINNDDGFTSSAAIWPEVKEFQTTPVGGINFAYPGNDFDYSNLLRHVELSQNDGSVLINLNLPNGNEIFEANITQKISWYVSSTATIDTVRIELSTDNGNSWQTVVSKTPNNGHYAWKIPKTPSALCLMRIVNPATMSTLDVSNAPFSIQYDPPVYKVPRSNIMRPTKDTTIAVNTVFAVIGAASDSDGYIVNYIWTMGDGETINGIISSFDYLYETPGVYTIVFKVQDNDNIFSTADSVIITVEPSNSVENGSESAASWVVSGLYPNPFNSSAYIRLSVGAPSRIHITVYNVLGQYIDSIVNTVLAAGDHSILWNGKDFSGRDVPSGMYMIRIETLKGVSMVKALLLR